MMQDQSAPGAPPPPDQRQPQAEGEFEIVIRVSGPDQIMVNDQPVRDVAEAMEMVQSMIINGGQPAGPSPGQEQRDMDDAMEGYGRGGLRGMPVNKVLRDDR